MSRPLGVTAIACFFFLAGVYLCSIAAIGLVTREALQTLKAAPFVRELRLVNPYSILLFGTAWAFIGWGLLRLRDWARFAATLVLAIGIAWAVPVMLLTKVHSNWRMLALCLEIVLRAAAVLYLFTPAVMDSFRTRSRSSREMRQS